jgi:formylmethanofuran dehydrogenase subunit B
VPSPEAELARATCAGCGCLCDDIEVQAREGRLDRIVNTCPLGDEWFAALGGPQGPLARVDGREADLDEALDRAAAILTAARWPLVYGLGATSVEAQREAVALADALGAVIDPSSPALEGPIGAGAATEGSSTATFGVIRDLAQVVVAWRADPAATNPRLLERLRLDRAGRAGEGPRRALVVVGDERSRTAAEADEVVALEEGRDLEALWTMRALARDLPLPDPPASPLPVEDLRRLVARLRGCENAAVLFGAGLAAGPAGFAGVHALHALVRDLSRETHVVALALRREGNALGAEDVLAWQTGYGAAVSFAAGHPRADAAAHGAAAVLARGAVDAALVVAADALADLPPPAAGRLREIPTVVVDPRATATADAAEVAFRPGAAGVHVAGTAHRMDGVPVALRAPLASARPGDAEILRALRERIGEGVPC